MNLSLAGELTSDHHTLTSHTLFSSFQCLNFSSCSLPHRMQDCSPLIGGYSFERIAKYVTYISSKESACNARDTGDMGLIPESGRPLEKEMATHSSILLGKSRGQRSLFGYSPWGHNESDTTEQLITYYYLPA